MSNGTYEITPPKTCRFCGAQMPTKETPYDNTHVNLPGVLKHFRNHPRCRQQLIET
jgi:hypothetical protein